MTKIVLSCLGKYLRGSGISNVFIECSVFVVLNGKNYIRRVKGMFVLGETMFRVQVKAFLK